MLTLRGQILPTAAPLDRRSFLTLGALPAVGLTLPQLLAARDSDPTRRDVSVILFYMAGGPSHIDMYDMKPGQPAEIRGPFSPVETNLSGLTVCDLMPRHAAIADRLAVVRSITHDLSVHDDATHWLQTGYPLLNARQKGQQHPSQGSIVSYFRTNDAEAMPPYVCIPEDYRRHLGFYEHAAFLSSRYNALDAGGDPSLGNYRPPDFALPEEMTLDRVEDRRDLFGALDRLHQKTTSLPQFADLDDVQQQSFELVCGSQAREAFDVSQESDELREWYGDHAYGQSALLARRLVEAGVSFVTVNLYEKDVDWWDDHYTIEKNLRKRLPAYDQALAALVEDLDARGMSDQVLVAAFGEFGRGPRIDNNAGRGHWPKAMHAVLSGGGLKCGQVIGSTTSNGGEPHDRPLRPGDLLATMYHALGIDHTATVPDLQNRPIPILEDGEPIQELV
ncbi:MAG: DUF1501 domain-containing protein [Planctomycetota bacterium]|nr:MAG: DUF1501 domain-containing protein [Planctomycetota bacterium]